MPGNSKNPRAGRCPGFCVRPMLLRGKPRRAWNALLSGLGIQSAAPLIGAIGTVTFRTAADPDVDTDAGTDTYPYSPRNTYLSVSPCNCLENGLFHPPIEWPPPRHVRHAAYNASRPFPVAAEVTRLISKEIRYDSRTFYSENRLPWERRQGCRCARLLILRGERSS